MKRTISFVVGLLVVIISGCSSSPNSGDYPWAVKVVKAREAQERADAVVTVDDWQRGCFIVDKPDDVENRGSMDNSMKSISINEMLRKFDDCQLNRGSIVLVSIPVMQGSNYDTMQRVSEVTNELRQFGFKEVLIQQGSSFIPPIPLETGEAK